MEWISGNVFIRPTVCAKAGDGRDGHKHNFDHTTIVFRGAVHVKAKLPNGRVIEQDFKAPSHFLVKAEVEHQIVALVDDTEFWCVYSHRTPQGDIVQEHTGWREAVL
jgi:hypothetical protein